MLWYSSPSWQGGNFAFSPEKTTERDGDDPGSFGPQGTGTEANHLEACSSRLLDFFPGKTSLRSDSDTQ
jgi:hypothetical protein